MAYTKAGMRATIKYVKSNYDRIEIKIPKGSKADLQASAERAGESVNSYVVKAVLLRMGISDWDELDDRAAD